MGPGNSIGSVLNSTIIGQGSEDIANVYDTGLTPVPPTQDFLIFLDGSFVIDLAGDNYVVSA